MWIVRYINMYYYCIYIFLNKYIHIIFVIIINKYAHIMS